MGPIDLLEVVGGHLDRLGCARFTTGSLASMLYGEPRFTNDVDMVVRISAQQVCMMADSFSGDDWYFSLDAATGRPPKFFSMYSFQSFIDAWPSGDAAASGAAGTGTETAAPPD